MRVAVGRFKADPPCSLRHSSSRQSLRLLKPLQSTRNIFFGVERDDVCRASCTLALGQVDVSLFFRPVRKHISSGWITPLLFFLSSLRVEVSLALLFIFLVGEWTARCGEFCGVIDEEWQPGVSGLWCGSAVYILQMVCGSGDVSRHLGVCCVLLFLLC